MPTNLLSHYNRLIDQCEIRHDPAQEIIVKRLQQVAENIVTDGFFDKEDGGFFASIFARKHPRGKRPRTDGKPNSLYLWGGVGRGKSMVMDLFFERVRLKKKRRVHFHAFMQEVHHHMNTLRKLGAVDDPLLSVAAGIAGDYDLLCFDEFQVHDITDAMLISRLFSSLFDAGMVIIFTSNRPPSDLYKGGLQRERFLPFINLVIESCEVIELLSAEDYRKGRRSALQQTYFTPASEEATREISEVFAQLTLHATPHEDVLTIQGRKLKVRIASGDVARFTFEELCAQPLGAADYLEIAEVYRTVVIDGIPELSPEKRNEAKRFVTLIDVLYDHHTMLICTAAVAPDALYPAGDGSFEFERTVSRLLEMQSDTYLQADAPETTT